MPATVLTIKKLAVETPQALSFEAVDNVDGAVYKNSGKEFLALTNSGEDAATATIVAQKTSFVSPDLGIVSKSNIEIALAAGATKIIAPLPRQIYNNAEGNVEIEVGGTGAADVEATAFVSA